MPNYNKNIFSFSLMELMVTIVLIGFAAAFAVPSYNNAIQKANERDAVLILQTIHGANEIYKIKNGEYFPMAGSYTLINSGLGLNIKNSSSFNYLYERATASTLIYTAKATSNKAPWIEIRINQDEIGVNNPCCKNPPGGCLYVPLCP